jgi:hypothetical protein
MLGSIDKSVLTYSLHFKYTDNIVTGDNEIQMNNTKTKTLAIVAVLMAAALVVGTAGTSVSTKSAFAASNNSGYRTGSPK